jgi:hypothetical protein
MTCFKVLGWQFPVHIFDLHTAYLAASNVLLPYDPDEVRKKRGNASRMHVALTTLRVGNVSTRKRFRKISAPGIGTNMGRK